MSNPRFQFKIPRGDRSPDGSACQTRGQNRERYLCFPPSLSISFLCIFSGLSLIWILKSLYACLTITKPKAHYSSRHLGILVLCGAVLSVTTPQYPKEPVSESVLVRTIQYLSRCSSVTSVHLHK